jgi:hypothetical protein
MGKSVVLDIETNGLMSDLLDYSRFPYKLKDTARLWVVSLRDTVTGKVVTVNNEEITREWLEAQLADVTRLGAHNGIKFDFLMLKLFGVLDYEVGYPGKPDLVFGKPIELVDTLVLSRLFNPDRYKGHSLEVWGERLGVKKIDFRAKSIEAGIISEDAPVAAEFLQWSPIMSSYCEGDTRTTTVLWQVLENEVEDLSIWKDAIKCETKLADLAVKREHLGFWFNKSLAIECLTDLQAKMEEISSRINPTLPPKARNATELAAVTPPSRQVVVTPAVHLPAKQVKKDGSLTEAMKKFQAKYGGKIEQKDSFDFVYMVDTEGGCMTYPLDGKQHTIIPAVYEATEPMKAFVEKMGGKLVHQNQCITMHYNNLTYMLPYQLPLEEEIDGTVDQIDHVKEYLIKLGWEPIEWKERDLTKDSKKQPLSLEKQQQALARWVAETLQGKYRNERLEILELTAENLHSTLKAKLGGKFPVRVPTSPCVRVGTEKKLCPNLEKIGEKVAFAADFALYLTYKHRRNSIAGGGVEDIDFDADVPPSGYLAQYREIDERIPTPAIEIGCSTTRYKHIGVANIPRPTSVYGDKMRALFGSGPDAYEFGFDFASLEARIMGHYVIPYDGEDLAKQMVAEKPNDWHSISAAKLNISRTDCKSLNYGLIYGAQAAKIAKMLSYTLDKAKKLYDDYWEAVPPLKLLKQAVEKEWMDSGKKSVPGIDGRRIVTRSQHSLLNALFQSAGVIAAKYTTVFAFEMFEEAGLKTNPFEGRPDVCSMIEYHRQNCGVA